MEGKENEKEQSGDKKKTFRWLFSIVGEVLLIVPIIVILVLMGGLFR